MSAAPLALPLVKTQWLRQQMLNGAKNLRVLDGSWHLPITKRNAKKEYEEKRIHGAVFFDIDECADKSSTYDHMIPSAKEFGEYVQKLGIRNDTHVVVYDRNEKFGVFSAPRVWWTFRVFGHNLISVVDGGLPKWCEEGFPTASGSLKDLPEAVMEPFKTTYNRDLVADYDFILRNISSPKKATVIDTRPLGRFQGADPEPRADLPSGHMPCSKSFFFAKCIDMENKVMKDPKVLKSLFEESGIDLASPLVTSCGSGISGALLLFASYLAGKTDTKLYDGSWTEFVQRATPEMNLKGEQ